ncbi:DUF930 domain-containing protein [Phyllobacterium sp. BT25]|uniref:DUF930 domain-containing protein n=1 Tax=Phyllobacterium pellucidum TaxID=2740464 RepID=A0A849VIT9_9HYPH|nr:DUF930 domain-containing protein [Phyllobacterium pellucidum]NTS30115.1 DUF930 domain-containing protein [Phyllobacterium pellucidum]
MKTVLVAVALAVVTSQAVFAMDAREETGLRKLDPQTRLEQRCDVEAMERIRKDEGKFNPDKVLAYAFAEPRMQAHGIQTRGAAFRSGGAWYHLKYKCETSADNMQIVAFKYKIGDLVPEKDWTTHFLVP